MIALDAIAVIVHPDNKVRSLDTQHVEGIFTGTIRDWSAVGGAKGPIEVDALDRRINSLDVEIQKKFSIPAACIVFVLVGAPLGIRARKSGIGVAFLSILFFVFYYLCLAGGEELADRRFLDPAVAMWTPNVVIGLIGLYLTLRAAEVIPRPRRRPRRVMSTHPVAAA